MSLGTFQVDAAFAFLEAGVSLKPILQVCDWARASTPAKHHFSSSITTTG